MQDALNTLTLLCAALAALAFGVMSAYGICRVAFAAFRMHARSVAAAPPAKAQPARIA